MDAQETAIRLWVEENRPDLLSRIDALIADEDSLTLLSIGFEAGREHERDNPSVPQGPMGAL